MKHVLPAAILLSLAAAGVAGAQTTNSTNPTNANPKPGATTGATTGTGTTTGPTTGAPTSPNSGSPVSPSPTATGPAPTAPDSSSSSGTTEPSRGTTPNRSTAPAKPDAAMTPNTPNNRVTGTTAGTPADTAATGGPNVNTSIRNGDPATKDGNTNNAVNTRPENNPGAPHPGANSFTEGQARSRMEDHGFKDVKDLKKDDQGIWRGQATKDGKQTSVALDYQGNVVGQ